MKKKMLISSSNPTLVKDFFMSQREDVECLSTSDIWEDVKAHINVWQPDVYVCQIEEKTAPELGTIKNLAESRYLGDIPVVIITSEKFAGYFSGGLYDNVMMILCKPITISDIVQKTLEKLARRDREKALEEERRLHKEELLAAQEEANRIKNILVVDDDINVLKLLKASLDEKYNVATMLSGKMAEKYLESKQCDLIILDYEMPVENGPEVFKKIKGIEKAKDIPIVFLTGVAEKEKIAEVLMLKPQGYLLKPIDMNKLLDIIEKNIG